MLTINIIFISQSQVNIKLINISVYNLNIKLNNKHSTFIFQKVKFCMFYLNNLTHLLRGTDDISHALLK